MKKNYIFTLLLTLCFSYISFGQIVITELADPNNDAGARFVELYNISDASIDMNGWSLRRYTNGNAGISTNVVDLTPIGNLAAGGFVIIAADGNKFETVYGMTADISAGTGGPADSNGDDQMVVYNSSDEVVDIFGVPGEDGTGTCHEFEDGRAERKSSVTASNTTWNETEWNVWADSTISGCTTHVNSPRNAPDDYDPRSWIGASTTTEPSIAIISPSNNQEFESTTTDVTISFSLSNFTLSGDNGSEMSDNTGDGYILGSLVKDGAADGSKNVFTNSAIIESVDAGSTYILTAELVDNAGASLTPKVETTVTFSVKLPCDLSLGDMSSSCDAITPDVDTYSGTIAFTGGNSGVTYTITAPSGVTVGGDSPDNTEAGTITFTGMTEGMDSEIKIVGDANSSCDFTRTISTPICVPFPIIEDFDYTNGVNLADQSRWEKLNSGDDMIVSEGSLDYTGLKASTGNKISFDGTGSETYTQFINTTSGTVYASFLLKVTAFQDGTNPDLNDGGYIAALAGSTSGYDARFWVRPNPDTSGTTFDIGFGAESSSPPFTTGTYALNEVLFVVIAYDMDSKLLSTWVNPDVSSFEGTIPAATLSSTDTSPPDVINLFVLRQDSNNETPFLEIDEVRISTSWADVTPKEATASIIKNSIEGFVTYPNPVTNNQFTISSNSAEQKKVSIFNVIGKRVLSTSFVGVKSDVDVSSITSGLYILKVTEGTKTATSKLVIK
jgi:hypothetical protein